MNHVPVITFFNNKGGVGKTSLVYHLAWMFHELGKRVLAVDLDPQANLTSAFLTEDRLERLWDFDTSAQRADTIFQCVRPLTEVGDIKEATAVRIDERLRLVAGDLALAGFEDLLSSSWPDALGDANLYRPFRVLTAFWQVAQLAARNHSADFILADVGPNLGAINRSALIGSDFCRHPTRRRPLFLAGPDQPRTDPPRMASRVGKKNRQLERSCIPVASRFHATARLHRAAARRRAVTTGKSLRQMGAANPSGVSFERRATQLRLDPRPGPGVLGSTQTLPEPSPNGPRGAKADFSTHFGRRGHRKSFTCCTRRI